MSFKIDFYCKEKYQGRVPEPIPSTKFFPKWFSDIPLKSNREFKYKTKENDVYQLIRGDDLINIKKCLGITDFLNIGYLIPSWADFIFREQDNENLYINWMEDYYKETQYNVHEESQYQTMINKPIYGHFGKIHTPWLMKTSPGVSCLVTHPVGHRNKSFTSATGVVHTDKTPMNIAWFFEWNYKIKTGMSMDNFDIKNQVVPKGEPIILIIPFYRKNFTSKINYISDEKYDSINIIQKNLTSDSMGGQCPYKNFRKTFGRLFS